MAAQDVGIHIGDDPEHVCVVYEPGGRVVHVQEFFGERLDAAQYERIALESFAQSGKTLEGLRVLHPATNCWKPGALLRVVEGELVAS